MPSTVNDLGGNIDTDPLFVAPDNITGLDNRLFTPDDGFSLQPTSPCVNTGTSTDAPGSDITGTTRPIGGAWDMGAYEATSVSVFDVIDFDSGIAKEIKSFIVGLLGGAASAWATFVTNMKKTVFPWSDNLECGFKFGVKGEITAGEEVEVNLLDAGWGYSVSYSAPEDYWTIAHGFSLELGPSIYTLEGDEYLKIPGKDDGRPIYAGVELTGDLCLFGAAAELKTGIKKIIDISATLDGKLGQNLSVSAETPMSKDEFLSSTDESTIAAAILDSYGFLASDWTERLSDALGTLVTSFGLLYLPGLLGLSDDPISLLAHRGWRYHGKC